MSLPARDAVDHAPGRAQQWAHADDDLRRWVQSVVSCLVAVVDVTALYLHGSLATGGFYRPKSDVDVLVVVGRPLTDAQRHAAAAELLVQHDLRPIVGGLELSILRHDAVDPFRTPSPYELHFSEMWVDDVRRGGAGPHGVDPDLAAHIAMARSRGVALVGPEPAAILGEVPEAAFRRAVLDDARWITGGGVVESPVYGVLNLCRCLQLTLDSPSEPASKDEGAKWAMGALAAQHHPLIEMALGCYHSAAEVPAETRRVHGHAWDRQPLVHFASYAREILEDARR